MHVYLWNRVFAVIPHLFYNSPIQPMLDWGIPPFIMYLYSELSLVRSYSFFRILFKNSIFCETEHFLMIQKLYLGIKLHNVFSSFFCFHKNMMFCVYLMYFSYNYMQQPVMWLTKVSILSTDDKNITYNLDLCQITGGFL